MNKFQEGLQQQRKVAEQLRLEAAIPRVRVSECVRDIKKYCEQNAEDDVLIRGFPRPGDNPFKEKGGCAILQTLYRKCVALLDVLHITEKNPKHFICQICHFLMGHMEIRYDEKENTISYCVYLMYI